MRNKILVTLVLMNIASVYLYNWEMSRNSLNENDKAEILKEIKSIESVYSTTICDGDINVITMEATKGKEFFDLVKSNALILIDKCKPQYLNLADEKFSKKQALITNIEEYRLSLLKRYELASRFFKSSDTTLLMAAKDQKVNLIIFDKTVFFFGRVSVFLFIALIVFVQFSGMAQESKSISGHFMDAIRRSSK